MLSTVRRVMLVFSYHSDFNAATPSVQNGSSTERRIRKPRGKMASLLPILWLFCGQAGVGCPPCTSVWSSRGFPSMKAIAKRPLLMLSIASVLLGFGVAASGESQDALLRRYPYDPAC